MPKSGNKITMPGKSFLTVAIGLCVLIANVNAETADNVVSEAIEHAQGEAQGPVHEYVVQQAADQVPADIVPADAQTQRQVVESVNDAVDQGMPHMAVVTGAKADIIANAVEDGTAGAVIHIVKMGDPAPPPASAPAPKPVVSAPKEVVEVKKLATSLNEVLIKNGERVQKSQMKAHELVEKSKNAGQEAITKESFEKSAEKKGKTKGVSEMQTKEHCIKEKETKEDGKKEEIKQKLAIEKVKKEAAVKEADYKKSIRQPPAPKEGSDPATCLEKFIKKCKNREQYYHEFHYKTEKKMKEVKVKNKQALIDEHCKVTKGVCQEVFDLSNVREQKLVALVNTHTSQLEASIAKAEQVSADEAKRVKFDTCARAAKDMKYFLNRVLGMGGAPSIFSRALPTLSTPPAKLV